MSRKKKRALAPRRLRMNRAGRLQSGPNWLGTQAGRTPTQIAKSYRKHFGVDWPCAIQELSILGVHLDGQWVSQLYRSLDGTQRKRREEREARRMVTVADYVESDDQFAHIVGHTPGGAAFGVTWEEWKQMEADERGADSEGECPF